MLPPVGRVFPVRKFHVLCAYGPQVLGPLRMNAHMGTRVANHNPELRMGRMGQAQIAHQSPTKS